MHIVPRLMLVSACVYVSGCAGQLKTAMLEHARATQTVADTLSKSTAAVRCDGMAAADKDGCAAALGVITEQAGTLRKSAEKLSDAAR